VRYELSLHVTDYSHLLRSIHNTRIERLWYDVTRGFGRKWKDFFLDLEHNHGLDPSNSAHIWLLQYLFLHTINADAQLWADTWNSHKMTIAHEPRESPAVKFLNGMINAGARGLASVEPATAEEAFSYGIDWDAHDTPHLMNHLRQQNPGEDTDPTNPFATPSHIAEVVCVPPNCPFNQNELLFFSTHLHQQHSLDMGTADLLAGRRLWDGALNLAHAVWTMRE
jgi:hypothetical protein